MYNDANLPDDEAWMAMAQDLRETKEARNNLTKENSCVISFLSFLLQYSWVLKTLTCTGNWSESWQKWIYRERSAWYNFFVCLFDDLFFHPQLGWSSTASWSYFLALTTIWYAFITWLTSVFIILAYSLCRTTDHILYCQSTFDLKLWSYTVELCVVTVSEKWGHGQEKWRSAKWVLYSWNVLYKGWMIALGYFNNNYSAGSDSETKQTCCKQQLSSILNDILLNET